MDNQNILNFLAAFERGTKVIAITNDKKLHNIIKIDTNGTGVIRLYLEPFTITDDMCVEKVQ